MWYRLSENQDMLKHGENYLLCSEEFDEMSIMTFCRDHFISDFGSCYSTDGTGLFYYMIPVSELTSNHEIRYNDSAKGNNCTCECSHCKNYSPES